ncbi:hypothetical protein K488DRAFT_71614 [Vararia minispora EC-137]|uniref:Uncharacterized protein n=1 Tax=Vararia minispora EC-137 TaxID=1314806 RepID=A0ACB8QHQ2_9AGAM|nr:hypothetical protein K488DRAFT_71614 [Vararia minispora EC-137]
MASSTSHDIYTRICISPSLRLSVVVYSEDSCTSPALCVPTIQNIFGRGRRHAVQLSGDLIRTSFYQKGPYLVNSTSHQHTAFVFDDVIDAHKLDHLVTGCVFIRAINSLIVWGDTPDRVIDAVLRTVPLPSSQGYEEWEQYLNFDVVTTDDNSKPIPTFNQYNIGSLLDSGVRVSALEELYPDVFSLWTGADTNTLPAFLSPLGHASPISSGASDASCSLSLPSSVTSSPDRATLTLDQTEAVSPHLTYSKKRLWEDDGLDCGPDADILRVPRQKRRAIAGFCGSNIAHATTIGAHHVERTAETGPDASPSLRVVSVPMHATSPPQATEKPRKSRKSSGRKTKPSRSTKPQKYTCEYCDRDFTRSQDLQRHIDCSCAGAPADSWTTNWKCDKCGETFRRKDAAKRHVDNKSCGKAKGARRPAAVAGPASM